MLGENGAGKSTLGKIVAGMYRADGGRILIDGHEARFTSPRDAALAGVAIVHQELIFCPNLSIAENLCLHDLPKRGWFLDRSALRARAQALLAEIGLEVDVDRPLSSLSIAQEQLVQIAAAIGSELARILASVTTHLVAELTRVLGKVTTRMPANSATAQGPGSSSSTSRPAHWGAAKSNGYSS